MAAQSPVRRRGTPRPSVVASALPLGLLAICCARTGQPAPPPAPLPPVAVRSEPIEWLRRSRPVHAVGTLSGKEQIKLSFKTGGIVERLLVEEGRLVHAGQLLASLKLDEIGAVVTEMRSRLAKAERDKARVANLYEGKAATIEQLQDATTATELARAALAGAAFNEEHSTIRAPVSGKIVRRMVERNELVAPAQPVLLLRGTGRGWVVRADVSDRDIMRLAVGDPAELRFGAVAGRVYKATVTELAEDASPGTGTYDIELRLEPGATPSLRSGLVADVTIRPGTLPPVQAFIPVAALQDGEADRALVYVPNADGTRAVARPITVAYIEGGQAAVTAGLDGATAVITDGAERLAGRPAIRLVASDRLTAGIDR